MYFLKNAQISLLKHETTFSGAIPILTPEHTPEGFFCLAEQDVPRWAEMEKQDTKKAERWPRPLGVPG